MIIAVLRFVNILNINQKKLIIKSNKRNNKKKIYLEIKLGIFTVTSAIALKPPSISLN
jgi:hypothetical protein